MKTKSLWVAVVCVGLPLCIGCNATSNTVRGQSPRSQFGGAPPQMQAAPMYAQGQPNMPMMQPASMTGHPGAGGDHAQNCPLCQQSGQGQWRGWTPIHHQTYSYKPPKNLVYPPDNQPAGVVQYPYYTTKGPTDFFYK